MIEVVFACANFREHRNINLPLKIEKALGRAFITPTLHRWHHGLELQLRNSKLRNSKCGIISSLWGRLGGSFGENRSSLPDPVCHLQSVPESGPRWGLALYLTGS